MIASLTGLIQSKKEQTVIVDVNGVGYCANVSLDDFANMPAEGQPIFFHIHTYVKEDGIQLYGFLSEENKTLFETLIKISGIGPKLALAILSAMPASRFIQGVTNEDISLLISIPGVGKKTAARIILELKEKLPSIIHRAEKVDPLMSDSLSALVNLGYKRADIEPMLKQILKTGVTELEPILKEALKRLSKTG